MRQKKQQLAALGQWTHINCLKPNVRENIQDPLLRKLVYIAESDTARKPQSQSRLDPRVAAREPENVVQPTAPPLAVESVPGGSVSFLFERTHKTALDEDGENLDE